MHDHQPSAAGSFVEAVQAPYRAALHVSEVLRERNTNYFLTLAELTGDMIQEPTPETFYRNLQTLADERVKQREALGAVISETTSAYLDFFNAPFYYLRGE
ncbi:MAG: hypothetical protein ACR2HO_02395 [Rubrobacteraceae bacterium]|nr:hypothetical protein [Rubrobacter sp.]